MTRRPAAGLIEIAARCRHLLLDFDGPVCSVFAGTPAPAVARELRLALSAEGIPLPGEALNTGDSQAVFRVTARHHPDAAELANRELTRLEFEAVIGARPTEGELDRGDGANRGDQRSLADMPVRARAHRQVGPSGVLCHADQKR